MPHFEIKQSANLHLTSHAGLALIGQCCQAVQLDVAIDSKMPVSQGMRTSDIVKSVVGLITLGKNDFDAIEAFREDRFFKRALGLQKVPSSSWMRQRLNLRAADIREHTDELSYRLIERTKAPIAPHKGFTMVDADTFVMNNEGSKKECVGRTYQGVDGYTPIAAYLGNEGWCLGIQLRPGVQHSNKETDNFLQHLFPAVERLVAADAHILYRKDSGFDSKALLFQMIKEKARLAAKGRNMDFIIKWNPRRQNKPAWVAKAEAAQAFQETRPGKRVALLSIDFPRTHQKKQHTFRLIVRITERTIDKKGQSLLLPEIELEGWWTSLSAASKANHDVIDLYKHHGAHEQFHSEFKTDLDLERLPSGKFDTNDAILHLGMFAYNCLRLVGQLGLTGKISPVRHPAKRRRLKTVLQEIMYRAAKVVHHARQWALDFGRGWEKHAQIFTDLQTQLRMAAAP